MNQWNLEKKKRSVQERATLFGKEDNKGYKRKPLLDLDPWQCPPDLLHLKKGVISKCLNQVFAILSYCIKLLEDKLFYQSLNHYYS